MSISKMQYDASDILNYPANHHNPTTQTNYANNVKNWVETEKYLVDCLLWQPNTAYEVGSQIRVPSLGSKYFLMCTTAGTSGNSEPNCSGLSAGSNINDGTAKWAVSGGYLPLSGGTINGPLDLKDPYENDHVRLKNSYGDHFSLGWEKNGNYIGSQLILVSDTRSSSPGSFLLGTGKGTGSNSCDLVGKPDGTLTWDGKAVATESQAKAKDNQSNLSSSTSYTEKISVSVAAGTWLVTAGVLFPANATGKRGIELKSVISSSGGTATNTFAQQEQMALSNGTMSMNASGIAVLSNAGSIKVALMQNSGSTLSNVYSYLYAQKLSDYTSFST